MGAERERMVTALMTVKSRKIDILNENVRVCAMLSDLEPELRKERRRVKALYETGAVRLVAMAVAAAAADEARACLLDAAQVLVEEADMTFEAAAETVNYFAAVWYGLPRLDYDKSPSAKGKVNKNFARELSGFSNNEPAAAFSDSVSAAGAEQLTAELLERYSGLLDAKESAVRRAERLCALAMLILPYFPSAASGMFEKAVLLGGREQLSLVGRQILSWRGYMGYEPALGFAMVKKAAELGARKGYLTLGYCYHNAVGICRCRELAEKYYLLACSIEPDCKQICERYLERLAIAEEYDDGLWRFY